MSIQTASAGRVLLKFKGNWSALGSYAPLDCTYHSGSTYVCKNNVSSSTTPDQDTTNWQILASGFDAAAVTALKNQITTGSSFAFVIGSTTYTDVESALGALKALYDGEIGTLSNLTTTDKSSLVSAVNEVKSAADTASNKVGTLTNLTTTSKIDTVSAINEVKSAADSASTKVGTLSNLTTTAKTDAVSAINEVKGLADSAGSAASTASTKVGTLSNLTTTAKTDAVSAINEVNTKLSKTEDLIAYVQTTLTASKAYAKGEQFVYNGFLYKATAAIAQGGAITIDGNCELADCITKQIKEFVKVKKVNATIETSVAAGAEYANSNLKSIASEFDNYSNIYILGVPEINGVNFANFQVKYAYINNAVLAIAVRNLSSATQVLHNVNFYLLMTNPK